MAGLSNLCAHPPATAFFRPSLAFSRNRTCYLRAKLSDDNDPLLDSAITSASLRFRETHRPEPLFLDPYAGCFVPPNLQMEMKQNSHKYCIATKFIDDKLLQKVNHIDGLKQVVLLTDGMDTRPYRLNWPSSTVIFDISPESVFKKASERLKAVGAKIPRSCFFIHVPLEADIQKILRGQGFNGNRPSIWAIQGLPLMSLANFEEILLMVGSLAANGCFFLGELPAWLAEPEIKVKSTTNEWMEKIFMSYGFGVEVISHEKVARALGRDLAAGDYRNIPFLAEQLRFSDDQVRKPVPYKKYVLGECPSNVVH